MDDFGPPAIAGRLPQRPLLAGLVVPWITAQIPDEQLGEVTR